MPIVRGDTFLMPTPNGMHLFIVASNPCAQNKVVLVSISSWKGDRCDHTCRFGGGHHPFVNHDSYAVYNFSQTERCVTIQAGLDQGRFVPKEPFADPMERLKNLAILA